MRIQLVRKWNGLPVGSVIEVGDSVAKKLVQDGVAKSHSAERAKPRNKAVGVTSTIGGES